MKRSPSSSAMFGRSLRPAVFLRRHLEHDAAGGLDVAQAGDQRLLRLRLLRGRGRLVGGGDVLCGADRAALDLALQAVDRLVQLFLLINPVRFAREFRAEQIGVRAQAADARDQLAQGLARLGAIDARIGELAFQPHILGLLGDGHLEYRRPRISSPRRPAAAAGSASDRSPGSPCRG